jgi:hypothetical protein
MPELIDLWEATYHIFGRRVSWNQLVSGIVFKHHRIIFKYCKPPTNDETVEEIDNLKIEGLIRYLNMFRINPFNISLRGKVRRLHQKYGHYNKHRVRDSGYCSQQISPYADYR